jgi:hypothetical protein
MKYNRYLLLMSFIFVLFSQEAFTQMQRQRANPDAPVTEIFLAPTIIGTSTVSTLQKGDLNYTVKHNFGLVSGGIQTLYGLDQGAGVRLGFAYGLSDNWQIGIGRTNVQDLIDLNTTYRFLRQKRNGDFPVDVATKLSIGIITEEIRTFEEELIDRVNYLASLMVGRKFGDRLSLQISPMIAHFNTVVVEEAGRNVENTFFGTGIVGHYKFTDLVSVSTEYVPVLSTRSDGTFDPFGVSLEFDTGGHVFQVYLTSADVFTEQQLLAGTTNNFLDGEFQIGFTINRVF